MTRLDFGEYVSARGQNLLRFAFVLAGDRQVAQDITQTALTNAFRRWEHIQRGNQPEAYVRRAIVNEYLSHNRRIRPLSWLVRSSPIDTRFEDPAAVIVQRDHLWKALEGLPPRARAVMVLRYYEDADDQTIAEILHVKASTVRSTASRALATLRDRLTETGINDEGQAGTQPSRKGERMKDIELALRDTLAAAASGAPPADALNIDAITAGRSRRRPSIIVAAAAAVLLVGTGLTLAVSGDLGEDGTRAASLGTPIVVATSSWKPGDGGDAALLTGTLRATSEGCPYVDASTNPAHPSPVALVWPAGYQARRAQGGGIEVTARDGSVVIREGDRFQAGGGYSESKGLPCTLGAASAFGIQSSISREWRVANP